MITAKRQATVTSAAIADTIRASISFPQELYERLEALANHKKVSIAWIVRGRSRNVCRETGEGSARRQGGAAVMKLIRNTGNDRVTDELRCALAPPASLDVASPAFSLFAFSELRDILEKLDSCRVVLGANGDNLGLTGLESDRGFRNRLNVHWLARECASWVRKKAEVRATPTAVAAVYPYCWKVRS